MYTKLTPSGFNPPPQKKVLLLNNFSKCLGLAGPTQLTDPLLRSYCGHGYGTAGSSSQILDKGDWEID